MRVRFTVITAVLLVLSGCSPSQPVGATVPSTPLPGLQVEIAQARIDIARNKMSIRVINSTDDPVLVTRAAYLDDRLAAPLIWSGSREVPPGRTRDLRIDVPEASCASEPPAEPTTELTIQGADSEPVSGTHPVSDPLDFIATMTRNACFERDLATAASVELGEPRTEGTGRSEVLVLPLQLAPGRAGSVRLRSVQRTVLLQPESGEAGWQLDASTETGAGSVDLRIVPTRCDLHAIGEDKVGTRFLIAASATVNGQTRDGTITRWATPEQKTYLFDYIRRWCAAG